ncbi:hypothetical protein CAEBREN_09110 [Caenorhabditis brenneri]|uniref:Uncharacterized protein n=1 Tax=Caenorhabditis brenneri TaxID=135651 RepID=G0MBY2_CAEBE|nr:hypothetical protein CAEBREN_09110 [Caenorhabditis brenneri]
MVIIGVLLVSDTGWEDSRYEECKQYFKCTHPSGNQGLCGHVGTFGELSEHFARHTKQYRIRCSNCEQRFVEEGFYFLHLNINNKKRCQEEHRSDIRHSAESVRVVWKSRNNHIKASTKEEYDDFIADKASKTPVTPTINAKSRSAPARDQRQSVKKPRNEQVCQEKEAVETNPIPVNQPVQSNESLPDAQRNVLNPQSVSSSPESAADLQLTDVERTPGGFVSTETRPPSTENPIIGEEQSPASAPPLRQNQEYEQPMNNDFLSESWRPPLVPVGFDPRRPPPPLGVQVPTQTFESRRSFRASEQQVGSGRVEKEAAPQDRPDQRPPTAQQQSPGRPDSVPLSSAFSALDLGHQDRETGQRTGDFPVSSSDHSLRGPEDLKEEHAQRALSPQPVPPPNPGQYSLNDLSAPWSTEAPRLGYHRSIGSATSKSAQTQNFSRRQDLLNQTDQRPVEPQVVRPIADTPAATHPCPVETQKSSHHQPERRSREQERSPTLDPLRHFRGLNSIGRSAQVTTAVSTGQPPDSLFQFPTRVDQQPRSALDGPRPEPIAVRTDSQNELDANEVVHEDSVHDFDHDLGRDEPMDIDQEPAATIPQDAQTPPGSPEERDSEPEPTRLSGRPPSSAGSRSRRVRRDSDESYRPDSPVRRNRSRSAAKKKKKRGPAKPRKGAKGRKPSNRRRSSARKYSESSEDSNMFDDDDAPARVPIRGAPSAAIQQNSVSELPDYESPDDEPAPAPPRRGRPPTRTSQVTKPVAKRTRPPTPEDSEDSVESYHPPQKTTRGRRRSSGAREYDYDPPYRPPVANVSARPTERRRTRSQGAADESLELPKRTRRRKSTSTVQKDTALSKIREQLLRQRTPEQVLRQRTPEQVLRERTPEQVRRQRTPEQVQRQRTPEQVMRQRTPEPEISDHEMEERAPRDPSVEGEDEYEEVAPVQEVAQNDAPVIQEVKQEPREEPRRSRPEFRRPVGAARGSPDIEIISHMRNGRVLSLFSNPSTRESSLARQGSEQRDSTTQPYPVDREFYDRNRVEARGGPVQNQPRNPPRPPQEVRIPPRQPQPTISQGPRQSRPPLLGTRPHQPRNPVPVPNTSSLRPPVDTSGLVSSRIMRPDEFHRGATHTRYHPGNVKRTLSRGSSGGRSASGGSSGDRDEERRDEPRARAPAGGRAPYRPPSRGEVEYVEQAPRPDAPRHAPSGGRAPYRPPSRGEEENREAPMAPRRSGRTPVRRSSPVGQAQVPPAQSTRQPPSRGQVMDRQERIRMEILREQQIARQQVDQLARGFEQIVASGEARTKAIQEEAAKKKTIMERAT